MNFEDFIVQLYRERMRLADKFQTFTKPYKQSLKELHAAQLAVPPSI